VPVTLTSYWTCRSGRPSIHDVIDTSLFSQGDKPLPHHCPSDSERALQAPPHLLGVGGVGRCHVVHNFHALDSRVDVGLYVVMTDLTR
jgi:hypothetical protein